MVGEEVDVSLGTVSVSEGIVVEVIEILALLVIVVPSVVGEIWPVVKLD